MIAVGFIVGAIVTGIAAADYLRADDGRGATPEPQASVADVESSAAAGTGAQTPLPSRAALHPADACAREIAATENVVNAVRIAAGHWREHVQARTDLLSGKNDEATTKATWKRTRLAGPAGIASLAAATTAERLVDGSCAGFSGPAAEACRVRLAAFDAAAAAGRAAAADWADHLAKMRAHAAGDFDADHAQQVWVAAWQNAPKNLDAFARADAELTKAPGCQPT